MRVFSLRAICFGAILLFCGVLLLGLPRVAFAQAAATGPGATDLERRLQAEERKLAEPPAPPANLSMPGVLSTLVGAIVGAIVSGVSTWAFAKRSEAKARQKENLAAALKIVEDWIGLRDTIGDVRWALLKAPETIRDDPGVRNKVITYGNWLELMATRWREDMADVGFLRRLEMDRAAHEFWVEFEAARVKLDAAVPRFDLEPYRRSWTALAKLASPA